MPTVSTITRKLLMTWFRRWYLHVYPIHCWWLIIILLCTTAHWEQWFHRRFASCLAPPETYRRADSNGGTHMHTQFIIDKLLQYYCTQLNVLHSAIHIYSVTCLGWCCTQTLPLMSWTVVCKNTVANVLDIVVQEHSHWCLGQRCTQTLPRNHGWCCARTLSPISWAVLYRNTLTGVLDGGEYKHSHRCRGW